MFSIYKTIKEGGLEKQSSITSKSRWIDLCDPSQKDIDKVCSTIKLRQTAIKHCLDVNEVPRYKEYSDYMLVVLRVATAKATKPFGFIKKGRTILTVHKSDSDFLKKYAKNKHTDFNVKSFLLEFLTNTVEDFDYLLESFVEKLDEMEKDALDGIDIRKKLFTQKKHLIYIRKALLGNKELITKLNLNFFTDKNNTDKLYDLHTTVLQQVDTAALIQERLSEITNISLTTLSNKLNETMKTFTIFALILMFPTLISGIYGMNFKFMPELNWRYGYPFAILLMILSVIMFTIFFRKKKWI